MTWVKITQRIDERKQVRLELVTHNRHPALAIIFGETIASELKLAGAPVDVFRGEADNAGWLRVEPSKDGEFQVLVIKHKKRMNVCRIPVPDGVTVAAQGPVVVPHELDGKSIKVSLQPLLGFSKPATPAPKPAPTPVPAPTTEPTPPPTPPFTTVEVSKHTFDAVVQGAKDRNETVEVYRAPAKPSSPPPPSSTSTSTATPTPSPTTAPPPAPSPSPSKPIASTAGEGEIPPPWRGKPAETTTGNIERDFKTGRLTLIGSYLFWNLKDKVALHKDAIPIMAALLKGQLSRKKAAELSKKDIEAQIVTIRTALRTLQAVKLQTLEYGWDIVTTEG